MPFKQPGLLEQLVLIPKMLYWRCIWRPKKESDMDNGKILKVTLEFENKTYVAKGKNAEDWLRRVEALEMLGMTHSTLMDGCDFDWTEVKEKKQ